MKIKEGDKVTTIYGEELTVLETNATPEKKKGVATGKLQNLILAESGGTKCWFSTSKLKSNK